MLTGRIYTAMYFFWLILGLYVVAPLLWRVIADRGLRERLAIAVGLHRGLACGRCSAAS